MDEDRKKDVARGLVIWVVLVGAIIVYIFLGNR
jgi:hypothetical protein